MPASTALTITPEQIERFRTEGFFILERVIPDEHLELIRSELDHYIRHVHAEMDRQKTDVLGINHRHKRYFLGNRYRDTGRLIPFLWSDYMAEVCRATLGPEAFLFNEQYVVKCAEVGMKFAWHQDSGYVGHEHRPYLSCWCALDDVSEANGTVYVLPFPRAGTSGIRKHVREEGTNDLVGYHGNDPGVPVIAPAGSIAVFSSVTFHRSGANTTDKPRRVYLAQYSAEPITNREGTGLWGKADPVLKNGQPVAPPKIGA